MAADTFRLKLPIQPLVTQMLDELSDHIWTDPDIRFLDPAFGGGQFLLEIERRLKAAGHSAENIANRVWGCESLPTRVKYVQNWFKSCLTNLYVRDALTHDWGDMKFDVIVGNPPYQSTESAGKKLWPFFVEKSYDLCNPKGFVALITPAAWMTRPEGRSHVNITKNLFTPNHVTWINLDANTHFDIGENVAAWVLHKNQTPGITRMIHAQAVTEIEYKGQPVAATAQVQTAFDIMNMIDCHTGARLKDHVYNDVQGKSVDHYVNVGMLFTKKSAGRVNVFWTAANKDTYFTPHKYQRKGVKIVLNLSGYYYQEQDDQKYMVLDSNNSYAVGAGALGLPCASVVEAKRHMSYLKSKLYQFYVNNEKTSGFNTGIIKLPVLDARKMWTNDQVYDQFGLTEEQRQFVDENYQRKVSG